MRFISERKKYSTYAKTGLIGLALISLAGCSAGDSTTPVVTSSGSAGLQGPIVFVNNSGDKTLTSVALKGDSGNAVLNTIPSGDFEGAALGDMQYTNGDWVFVNLGAANKVAAIDPLTAATPFRKLNLPTGTRPVHIYRDPNDGEVVWIMNDGDNSGGATPGDDLVNCALQGGGSVTAVHNSHFGPGGVDPTVIGTVCLLADGHKVAAFSSGPGVPKRVFVSSEGAGEIAVIDGDEASGTFGDLIARIDLCNPAKEAGGCNIENPTGATPFTPNGSAPHGIRWSKLTKKIYSIQEGYGEIAEIDPVTLTVTPVLDLAGLPYSAFGISPDGQFLLLRGTTPAPAASTKFGVIDLGTAGNPRTDFITPEQDGTLPSGPPGGRGSFKFSPDGKRLYVLTGNDATATKTNRLFAYDSSSLPTLTLLKEIVLVGTGNHSFDVLIQGAGAAAYLVVSNAAPANSLSIINAIDNSEKQTVAVGPNPTGLMVFSSGAALAGNQATSSLTGGSAVAPSVLPERLDDHGMKE